MLGIMKHQEIELKMKNEEFTYKHFNFWKWANRATLWSHTQKVSYLCNSKLSYMLSQPLKKLCISTMLFTYLLRCNDFTITWRIQLNLVCAKVSVSLPDDEWSTLSYCRSLSSRKLQKKEKEVNLLTRT